MSASWHSDRPDDEQSLPLWVWVLLAFVVVMMLTGDWLADQVFGPIPSETPVVVVD